MQEVTFDLQTITPLFLAGADQSTAELRAPSFRGEMRYWLRALVGGRVGTSGEGLKKVSEVETSVFGATSTGSAIQIRVSGQSTKIEDFRRDSLRRGESGKDYLLWSLDKFGDKPRRRGFQQNYTFQVILSTRKVDDTIFKQAIAAFWLLTHLGGIGSRSRRCAGSLQVIGDTTVLPFDIPETPQTLQDQLTRGIQTARSLCNLKLLSPGEAHFDAISQPTCRIWILRNGEQTWTSANEAMRFIGKKLQDYRSTITPLQRRKIFGLPLKDVDMRHRRSSPLLLRIAKLREEQYVGAAVLFKTKGEGVYMSDYALIEKWVTQDFPRALEVML